MIIIGVITSMLLTFLILPRILVVAYRKRLFDLPDARKVHNQKIPRLGGISFAPSIVFALSFTTGLRYLFGYEVRQDLLGSIIPEFYFFICGLTLLYLTGVKDDLVGLRYRSKFLVQLIAACLIPLSGLWINNLYGIIGIHELSPWIGIPLTVLVIVFICNAMNLIDGIDGLASGLSSVSLIILGSLFLFNGMWGYALLAFTTLGVLIPFFYYNFFGKAECCKKIFMGDTGSLTLGYILSFLIIRFSAFDPSFLPYTRGAIIISFSTLLIPLFDVFRVMLIRLRTHKCLFQGDRNHIHHKFLSMGFTQHQTLVILLLIACLFSAINIVLVPVVDSNLLIVIDVVLWVGGNMLVSILRHTNTKVTVIKDIKRSKDNVERDEIKEKVSSILISE